jgi:ABC-type transport system involved in cytochrome c biogenesis ATPase subunit
VLDNVRHVPDIRLNLLSVGNLDDIRHGSYFGDAKWKLTKGSLIVARGRKKGCLYVTKTKLCNDVLTITENETSAELWHKRLGHMSEKGMQALAHMFLLELKGITLKPCEYCFAGKQHRVAFRTRPSHHAENVLDIVHTDICSMTEKSLGGALYFDIH